MLAIKYKGFVHHIASDIDDERSTVIRELTFAGCVRSVGYVSRPEVPAATYNATGDIMHTDGSVAVIALQDCHPIDPQLGSDPQPDTFRPGNHAFRYIRRQILTFKNDVWRANIIYGAFLMSGQYDRNGDAASIHRPAATQHNDCRRKPTFIRLRRSRPST